MTNIIIVPVLVFTWIMGLFAVEGQEKIYVILFVLANVLQVKGRISCYKMFLNVPEITIASSHRI